MPLVDLRFADLSVWLEAQLAARAVTAPILPGTVGFPLPPQPDRVVFLTWTSGPGLQVEGAVDILGVQARCRGRQRDPDSAEALALAVDRCFVDFPWPADMGQVRVVTGYRLGGRPSPDRVDASKRTHFTGNYLLHAARL